MHTPAAALAWELWRRHRNRLITIIGLLLGFALVYPKLCMLADFDPYSTDALDEFARKLEPMIHSEPTVRQVGYILYLLFLVGGPATVMMLSLLYVTWMFTFVEFNPKTKDPMVFPGRIFTLPISTSFLFSWLLLVGLAAVGVLFAGWVYFVRQPHLEIFGEYQKCSSWMTLLVVAQGITWALAGWPITRMLALFTVLFCFLGSPSWAGMFESPFLLPTLFLLGAVLARVSLQRMRHGQWQGWSWKWPLPAILARAELGGAKRFASPAQAQLWFEWRRFARGMSFVVAALAVVPVVIHLVVRVAFGLGPLQDETLFVFAVYLVAMPIVAHFLMAVSAVRTDQSFLTDRPLANGEIMVAVLKAAAISTVLSWVAVFVALCGMPLLGNFRAAMRDVTELPGARAAIVIGLIFLTWRTVAVNLCFARSGNRRIASVPILGLIGLWAGAIMISFLLHDQAFVDTIQRFIWCVPGLLACLVAVKLLLACVGFRVSLKRGLLAPSALIGYIGVWVVLVAALLTAGLVLGHPSSEVILPMSLCIVLLVPLVRIAFCPIALAHSRHT